MNDMIGWLIGCRSKLALDGGGVSIDLQHKRAFLRNTINMLLPHRLSLALTISRERDEPRSTEQICFLCEAVSPCVIVPLHFLCQSTLQVRGISRL
jgi:hypothetical protein